MNTHEIAIQNKLNEIINFHIKLLYKGMFKFKIGRKYRNGTVKIIRKKTVK